MKISSLLSTITILYSNLAYCINVPYQTCFEKASKQYGVPVELLIAVAQVESHFNPNAINRNTNKTYDFGVMQINSIWLKQLNNYGITQAKLTEPCQNIMVGAWILAQKIQDYGFTWTAIQRYNGSDPKLGYAQKVFSMIQQQNPHLIHDNKLTFNMQPKGKPQLPEIVINENANILPSDDYSKLKSLNVGYNTPLKSNFAKSTASNTSKFFTTGF